MRATVWVAAAAVLGVAMPSRAQDKPVEVNVGAGYSIATGEARKHTGDAGVFQIGATLKVAPKIGIQANYDYTALGKEKTVSLDVSQLPGGATTKQQFSADFHMHDATFDVVFKPKPTGVYALAGPGVYHRTVNVTTPAVGFTTVCDPFWYVCYPVAVSVDKVLGSRSSTDMGINFGVGATFKLGDSATGFLEVRYVYIWGPTFAPNVPATGGSSAKSLRANGQFAPFVFGLRF